MQNVGLENLLKNAKLASREVAQLNIDEINNALNLMANELIAQKEDILRANGVDMESAEGISTVMLDRLKLNSKRIDDMAEGIRQVALLPSPVGSVLERVERPNGLVIEKVSVPMGVIAIIYESRPNVTADAASLAIKSGNACVLKSGKEAINSAKAIVKALKSGLKRAGVNENAVSLVDDVTRQSANDLMRANGYVDLLIPRGGKGLIKACVENATVPCLETGTGICHVYIDEFADTHKAVKIIENATTSRPSVCNAMEVCLVHSAVADKLLPELEKVLVKGRENNGLKPVELRLCDRSIKIINGVIANEQDYDTEFLDYIMAVKVVDSVSEAIAHILEHSTHHSEAIITENEQNANAFTAGVDSSAVYVNASTRFTDGGEFGLGCEMGISTQKLHARGPLGIRELTTYKYVIKGEGQIR